jgi:hypothetical protein
MTMPGGGTIFSRLGRSLFAGGLAFPMGSVAIEQREHLQWGHCGGRRAARVASCNAVII